MHWTLFIYFFSKKEKVEKHVRKHETIVNKKLRQPAFTQWSHNADGRHNMNDIFLYTYFPSVYLFIAFQF